MIRKDVLFCNFFKMLERRRVDRASSVTYAELNELSKTKEAIVKIRKVKRIARGMCKCKSSC